MKKHFKIIVVLSCIFIFWCTTPTNDKQDLWNDTPVEQLPIQESLIDTWYTQEIIDQYKDNQTWESQKLNENDIDLMEKIIEQIESQ